MISQAAARTTASLVTRRGFHATRARLSSPYHYPEGAYSNIPFNPRSKWFGVGYWGFMATGFFAPFGIAGAWFSISVILCRTVWLIRDCSLPNLQGVNVAIRDLGVLGPSCQGDMVVDRCVHDADRDGRGHPLL